MLFLDPYGMQVEWKTIEAIAGTRAIDMWLLFPLGIGVNRLLTKTGDIPESWRHRLNVLLGNENWYEEFYTVERRPNLFGDDEARVERASVETIGRYFNDRLNRDSQRSRKSLSSFAILGAHRFICFASPSGTRMVRRSPCGSRNRNCQGAGASCISRDYMWHL